MCVLFRQVSGVVEGSEPRNFDGVTNASLVASARTSFGDFDTENELCERLDRGHVSVPELCRLDNNRVDLALVSFTKHGYWALVKAMIGCIDVQQVFALCAKSAHKIYTHALMSGNQQKVEDFIAFLFSHNVRFDNSTIMMNAVGSHNFILTMFLERGAALNNLCCVSDYCGCSSGTGSPLLVAVFKLNVENVDLLLQFGANRQLTGESANHSLCSHSPVEQAQQLYVKFSEMTEADTLPNAERDVVLWGPTGEKIHRENFLERLERIIALLSEGQ